MLSLLLTRWQYIVIALLIAVLSAGYVYTKSLKKDITDLQTEITKTKTLLEVSQQNVKELDQVIQKQNGAIDDLSKNAEIAAAKSQAEMAKAKQRVDQAIAYATRILRIQPDPTISLCDNARNLIIEELRRVRN